MGVVKKALFTMSHECSFTADLDALELCEQLNYQYCSLSDDYPRTRSPEISSPNSSFDIQEEDQSMVPRRGNRVDGKPTLTDLAMVETQTYIREHEAEFGVPGENESVDTPTLTQEES